MKKIKLNFDELETNYNLLLEGENNLITGGYDLAWFIDFYNSHNAGSYYFTDGYITGYSDVAYTIDLKEVSIYANPSGGRGTSGNPYSGYNFNGTFTHDQLNSIYSGSAYYYYNDRNGLGIGQGTNYGDYGTGGTTKYDLYSDISTIFGFGTAMRQGTNMLLTSANSIAVTQAYFGEEGVDALMKTATMTGKIMTVVSRNAAALGVAYSVCEIYNETDDVHTYVNLAVTGLTVGAEIFIGATAAPYIVVAGVAYGFSV